jgi:hypothetical protein
MKFFSVVLLFVGFLCRADDSRPSHASAQAVEAELRGGKEMTAAEFAALLPASPKTQALVSKDVISRGVAMQLKFFLLP